MIRPAEPRDVAAIHQFIVDLAVYEREPDAVTATASDLERALFADSPALFADVAEVDDRVVGMAIWFLNYSTWDGRHGIYLEDLYVDPAHRGSGLGRDLLITLARRCVERGYSRFQWWVLDWNEPSIEFYTAMGAVAMDDWTVYRTSGEALRALAALPLRTAGVSGGAQH
ncbi:GNAT family N-acetyltransferase [Propioniciclava sinopodophylli]|uniref:GNAT family N-acetyltransferase n=1 Tax=Propioniciclava sinopodophylli TaxID=1837344 RepID=A0A4Q9KBX1_9ACTN|nr:GNAT family N-acetyltransferase [Propioniciclava sinopodophylli]TBT83513.1 GNAT family N-acetyltransferase [Propioniciclava sinopodophylli]